MRRGSCAVQADGGGWWDVWRLVLGRGDARVLTRLLLGLVGSLRLVPANHACLSVGGGGGGGGNVMVDV